MVLLHTGYCLHQLKRHACAPQGVWPRLPPPGPSPGQQGGAAAAGQGASACSTGHGTQNPSPTSKPALTHLGGPYCRARDEPAPTWGL
ncbi:hypothetical protein HaLaN_09127 [Haematococcus lacustris]|uniref:Uncharacterized protein n=1 Tax=Haematococcus lacustris TaxID=44745 RepID=A0A699YSU6_HAELA|nr:hypothetical protein HaLaN_09127 [Haematococcus lacustris]